MPGPVRAALDAQLAAESVPASATSALALALADQIDTGNGNTVAKVAPVYARVLSQIFQPKPMKPGAGPTPLEGLRERFRPPSGEDRTPPTD